MDKDLKTSIATEIRRAMDIQGISRTELARRLGVSNPYITEILSGSTNFTLDTIDKIVKAIDARIEFNILISSNE